MTPKVYVETSVVSYLTAWPSRDVVILGNQVATWEWVRLFFVGGPTSLCGGGEAGGSWIRQRVVVVRKRRRGQAGDPTVLVPSATAGGFRWYSRASWKVSVRIKAPAARGGLRTASRGRHADRPFDEPATSAARRIAAATWTSVDTQIRPLVDG